MAKSKSASTVAAFAQKAVQATKRGVAPADRDLNSQSLRPQVDNLRHAPSTPRKKV